MKEVNQSELRITQSVSFETAAFRLPRAFDEGIAAVGMGGLAIDTYGRSSGD